MCSGFHYFDLTVILRIVWPRLRTPSPASFAEIDFTLDFPIRVVLVGKRAKELPHEIPTWTKGQSGRPPGSLNKKTLAAQAAFEEKAQEIVDNVIERARNGDL